MRWVLTGCSLILAFPTLPATAESPWKPLGPPGGFVSELVIDPRTPSTLYAGVGNSLYKSINGGTTWTRILNRFALSIVLEPSGPGLFAGAYRSTDGGATWTESRSGLVGSITRLAIDPQSPSTLYAATISGEGLVKTVDGGANWFPITAGLPFPNMDFRSLAIDPTTPTTLYAGSEFFGVFKTTDGGATWFHADTKDEFDLEPAFYIYDIAVDPENPEIVFYGATFNEPGASSLVFDDRIMRTTNGAQLWTTSHHLRTDSRDIVFDPRSSSTLYATSLSEGLFKSTDRGASWSSLGGPRSMVRLAVDRREPTTFYAGSRSQRNTTVGGIYKSTDSGMTWAPSMEGLHGTRIFQVAVAPWDSATIAIVTDALGLMHSEDGGQTWTRGTLTLVNLPEQVMFDPLRPGVLYTLTAGALYRSNDGGATWIDRSVGVEGGYERMAIDPIDPRILYIGTTEGVFKSTDRGSTWVERSEGLPEEKVVVVLEMDPRNPEVLYVAVRPRGGIFSSRVFKTTDGAATWEEFLIPEDQNVTHFRIHPTDSTALYAVTVSDRAVIRSTDGGTSFADISEGLPERGITQGIREIVPDPTKPQTLYVVTLSDGIYQTIDGGLSWQLWSDEELEPFFQTMTFDPNDPRNVYVGTLGNGLWVRDLGGCVAGPTRHCLQKERFEVEVDWRTAEGQAGAARTVPPPARSDSSGLFYFFTPDNWEMLVKVLDGCAINGHYWVFAAATTDVEYTLRVIDTDTGEVWESTNPQGRSAPAITDAQAFATCR